MINWVHGLELTVLHFLCFSNVMLETAKIILNNCSLIQLEIDSKWSHIKQ